MSNNAKRLGRWQHRNADGTMPAMPRERKTKREPRSERDAWQHFMSTVMRAVVS